MTTMSPAMIARSPVSARPSLRPAPKRMTLVKGNPFVGETNNPDRVSTV